MTISSTLTEQQGRAVTVRDSSVVLSSGAGCGKTHVLTERYLSHLRHDHAEVGQIVAITFTDRAARQMRERIRRALVAELKRATADSEANRWASHLRNLETAPISTIHAFCGNLLRQHAIETGLDPAFEVLEEVLSANLEAEALQSCLQQLLPARTALGEDLRQLVLLYGWKPVVDALQQLMESVDEPAWRKCLADSPETIATFWRDYTRDHLLPPYIDYLLAASPKIANCLELLRTTPCGGPETREKVRRLLELTPRLALADDLAAAVEELREAAKVGRERAKAWNSAEDYETIKAAFEDFRGELPARMKLFLDSPEDLTTAAEVGQRFLRVATEAVRTYRQHKRRVSAVDFQDLLVLARDLLRDHADVRDRLRNRYRFLLIDELQDTDPVQMELIATLCGGGLTTGKLFAVGDHKQSIYRFRGADVHLFQDLRQSVTSTGQLGLTLNFRSQPAILHFANALFQRHIKDYESLEAFHPQVNPGPCVEFLWSPRGDKEYATEARQGEADRIARRVASMVAGQERLVIDREGGGQLRPVRPGDVVLLFRAMSNVQLYEAALRTYCLDYYLVGGRAFFAQQEIYDLLNLLRALENPLDAVSLAGTLRSPFCGLSDESLFLLGRHTEGLWAGLHDLQLQERLPAEEVETAARARRFLDCWHGLKDRLPITRLLGEVFADSGYDAAMQFEFLGDRKLANLWKLVEMARTFDRSGLYGLPDFIQRLGDLVRTQPREEQAATQPEKADVVRIMSIHQAKGLEFPVVIVPDLAASRGGAHRFVAHWDARLGSVVRPPADEEPPLFTDYAWELWKAQEAIEDWHEELRTLYVACTRAQDYLVLSASLTQPVRPANAWMLTLATRFHLSTGACRDEQIPAERRPRIRVTESTTPLPALPEVVRPERVPSIPSIRATPPAIEPIPVRLPERPILPVTLVDDFIAQRPQAPTLFEPLRQSLEAIYPQFDAEDGSDRYEWSRSRKSIERQPRSPEDRLLGAVLDRWDYADPEGWRPLLTQSLQDLHREADPQQHKKLAERLAAYAETMIVEINAARKSGGSCLRDVEFCLNWPQDAAAVGGCRPVLKGVIDWLWQAPGRGWQILLLLDERPTSSRARDPWMGRRLTVAAGFLAVQQQTGDRPGSLTLYTFADQSATVWSGDELREVYPDLHSLNAFAPDLTAFLGQLRPE